jgi:hypothetical protein
MFWLLLFVTTMFSGQEQHRSMYERGAMVMGFDPDKTVHHFYLYNDGGAIDIAVKDASDVTNRDAIRAHLRHIATMFGSGNCEAPMLVHDSTSVPGTAVLKAHKDALSYTYIETPGGGRVDIVTGDPAALTALHEFLRYQIAEHQTKDSATVTSRR